MTRPDLGATSSRLAKFATVGAANTAIDLSVFFGLVGVGGSPILANILAFVAAATFSFFGNRSWTFGDRKTSRALPVSYLIFLALNSVAGLSATGALGVLVWVGAPIAVAKFCSIGVSLSLNYLFMNKIIFRHPNG